MRDLEWEKSLYEHQHMMIKRLDLFRKGAQMVAYSKDETMVIEHSFQLLVASMLDLARYVLKHHYKIEISSRKEVLNALIVNKDVTYEQAEQIRSLIMLRDKILYDYLDENFSDLKEAMTLRRYSLVEVLTKEWITRLSNPS
ncbi:hypothetical protein EBI01_11360 [Marinomonas rhizomae]|uniref:Nucleotidyltransferase substrate binding protein (TIGR01987 family) n=1 Tax=Marinomonas rhizomae TaxID=491948 RepID=A0A366J6U4_9GAMM|nr:hypothetical protein [Marinomonas rhizomae]RBP81925.1 hypothetical protein DFP80_109225 [Marinomonas rhizomae]RNF73041.1 hypothetical protein EBI01_11360 [Marinomonas rhizomae]